MLFALPPDWPAFLLAALLIELTPGPNMTWLAVVTLIDGRNAGLKAVAGVATGLALLGIAAAFGVAEIVESSPVLWEVLRWAGVGALVYFAYDGWVNGGLAANAGYQPDYIRRGFLSNLLNPKAVLFYATVLPTFLAAGMPARPQVLGLTAVYLVVATAVHLFIVFLTSQAALTLHKTASEVLIRRILSGGLLGVALWFALATNHE